ncbi:MAG TPA: hypothetical protein VKG82_01900 [Solirubrobacteraceae bacterium]|nr:hypothetical protein [Solirubrobacteraceae bacterium]
MDTIVEPSPAAADGQHELVEPAAQNGATRPDGPPAEAAAASPQGAARTCEKCGSPMAEGQDWCLQCGAGAPGSLGTPGWRGAATVLGVTVALLLGAAAAGYAALSSSAPKARVVTATVAQASAPAPATTTPTPVTPLGPASTPTAKVPPITIKPPRIPLTTVTPKATTTTPPVSTAPATTTPASTETGGAGEETKPSAIVLDTNAASTYNPYNLPAANFGDPSLAIDGDTTTGWTAQVEPATAPSMAAGLLIDLKAAQKLSAIELITSTPGMTIQLYGANGKTVPASITEPAWVALTHSIVVHKRHQRITLRESRRAFRFVTLWISRVPASSVGTPQAPGHISVNELELFSAG